MFHASIVQAAHHVLEPTASRALAPDGFGVIAEGNVADLVVLDRPVSRDPDIHRGSTGVRKSSCDADPSGSRAFGLVWTA